MYLGTEPLLQSLLSSGMIRCCCSLFLMLKRTDSWQSPSVAFPAFGGVSPCRALFRGCTLIQCLAVHVYPAIHAREKRRETRHIHNHLRCWHRYSRHSPLKSGGRLHKMAQPVEQWITDIPPVTRTWVAAAIGASILVVSAPSGAIAMSGAGCYRYPGSHAVLIHIGMSSSRPATAVLFVEGSCR